MKKINKIAAYELRILFFAISIFMGTVCNSISGDGNLPIKIGISAPLNGHMSYVGINMVHGIMSGFNAANDSGGISGRRIELIAYDDDYSPPMMISNVKRLITEDKVLALIGLVGTPTTLVALKLIRDYKIPLLFPFTGAHELRYPGQPCVFNLRAGYRDECAAAVDYYIRHGKQRFAIFYQDDAYGENGRVGITHRLLKYDIDPLCKVAYQRGTTSDLSLFVEKIMEFKPEVIAMIGTYKICGAFIKNAVKHGMKNTSFYNISFVGGYHLASMLKDVSADVIVSQVLPAPDAADYKGVMEYRRSLKRYFPDDKPNMVSFEGFLNAKLTLIALNKMNKNVSKANLINILENMDAIDLGIGKKIKFSPENHNGLHSVFLTKLVKGELIPIEK